MVFPRPNSYLEEEFLPLEMGKEMFRLVLSSALLGLSCFLLGTRN